MLSRIESRLRSAEAGGFLRTSSGKERPMKQRQLRMPGWIRNGHGKEARVFVIDLVEVDSVCGSKLREAQSFPVKEIFRSGQGDSRPSRRKRRITHDVALERFDEGDAGVLASAPAVGTQFIVDFRLQRDAESLHADWVSGFVEATRAMPMRE
jgi:hypothetical protein